jgi:predicted Kef-type K+ transport protein
VYGLAGDIAMILVAAFVRGAIAQRLPLILGYILAGGLRRPEHRRPDGMHSSPG